MWKDSLDFIVFIVLDTDDGRPLVAGTGIEPVYAAYETAEQPLLPSRNEKRGSFIEAPPTEKPRSISFQKKQLRNSCLQEISLSMISVKFHNKLPIMVGTNGLEPLPFRLSDGRSHLLGYVPSLLN